jgi:general secretion pathway protein G
MVTPTSKQVAAKQALASPRGHAERRRRRQSAYSLMEILIVVAIIGLLVTLVAPQLFGRLDQSRVTAATAQIRMLRSAVDSFRLDNGRYPSEAEGLAALVTSPGGEIASTWRGPYLDGGRLPPDPWGNPYGYAPSGVADGPAIYSYGSDAKPGGAQTAKDLGNMPGTPTESLSGLP